MRSKLREDFPMVDVYSPLEDLDPIPSREDEKWFDAASAFIYIDVYESLDSMML
jgi:hypothetical protein